MSTPLPSTLEGLLLEGQRLYTKVSNADFDGDEDRDYTTARAKAALESLQMGVAREGVFSANEEVGEIATPVLPLLATDFYLGSLMIKLPFTNPQIRLKVLEQAEALLFKYLDTCERLQLFDAADLQAWQAMLKEAERSTSGDRQAITREQKIERFRRQQRTQQKMKEIEELLRTEGKDCEDEGEGDGMKRERSLLLLAGLASEALDGVSGMSKETEMLKHLVKAREQEGAGPDGQHARARRDEDDSIRSNGLEVTHISRVGGNLQIRKEDVRANVFKPTVALPTMTVEEFGEIELERATERTQQEAAAQKDSSSTRRRYDQLEMDGDEDDEDLVEQAAYHDRAWDDWKAENPRGAGNKANKII
ncbi:conserved unknown protein [Ectocarpus siliculosus]|uniref:TAP42-like protein n=1 Tax=Ectocarpus siliculosus TaxID=2880 RepID=D7FN43_ECTSI|nr:conserved unknown protein [Ectocarpus siliculosus]|eukprot:CBJ30104.1 conserved unknown protein [Ectocarpus siliculosus]